MKLQPITKQNPLLWLWALLLIAPLTPTLRADDSEQVILEIVLHVDDDAPNDPGPGDPNLSDPNEDGSEEHPYDYLVEAFDSLEDYDYPESYDKLNITVVIEPGTYQPIDDDGDYAISLTYYLGRRDNIQYVDYFALVGSDPNDFSVVANTIVDYPISIGSCAIEIAGLTLRGRHYEAIDCGSNEDSLVIRNCIIQGNRTCDGTVLYDFDGLLQNCLIADNQSTGECGDRYAIDEFSGTMENCTITGHDLGLYIEGSATYSRDGEIVYDPNNLVQIQNCIISNNGRNVTLHQAPLASDGIWIDYCNIPVGSEGLGYIDANEVEHVGTEALELVQRWWGDHNLEDDPLFASEGCWDTVVLDGNEYEVYFPGDYHLQSRGWRWSEQATHDSHWVYDQQTSPCIDAGDPNVGLEQELEAVPADPNGQYGLNLAINMGVYGGTHQASLAPVTPDSNEPDYWEPLWPVSSTDD